MIFSLCCRILERAWIKITWLFARGYICVCKTCNLWDSWFICKKPGHEANNSQSVQGNGLNIIHLFKCLTVKSGCYLRLYKASPRHKHVQSRVDHTSTIYTSVIFDYSCAMDRKTKCIPMFLFYGFGSCDSSIRSALLYQWPLLLSGGSPCCIGRESNPESTVP